MHKQFAIDVVSPITLHDISVEAQQGPTTLLEKGRPCFSHRASKYKADERGEEKVGKQPLAAHCYNAVFQLGPDCILDFTSVLPDDGDSAEQPERKRAGHREIEVVAK